MSNSALQLLLPYNFRFFLEAQFGRSFKPKASYGGKNIFLGKVG
jgi:hypothetical protein